MAGDTSRVDATTLRLHWDSHSSMFEICAFWHITKDQLIRLKKVVGLHPRHDRRLRPKPPRAQKPTAEEITASEASLSLAPWVAMRTTCVTVHWTEEIRASRQVTKPQPFLLRPVQTTDDMRDFLDDLNAEAEG